MPRSTFRAAPLLAIVTAWEGDKVMALAMRFGLPHHVKTAAGDNPRGQRKETGGWDDMDQRDIRRKPLHRQRRYHGEQRIDILHRGQLAGVVDQLQQLGDRLGMDHKPERTLPVPCRKSRAEDLSGIVMRGGIVQRQIDHLSRMACKPCPMRFGERLRAECGGIMGSIAGDNGEITIPAEKPGHMM
ncbi:MAG: hypothetical protein ABI876_13180 [Bacteroidota bacterium]